MTPKQRSEASRIETVRCRRLRGLLELRGIATKLFLGPERPAMSGNKYFDVKPFDHGRKKIELEPVMVECLFIAAIGGIIELMSLPERFFL